MIDVGAKSLKIQKVAFLGGAGWKKDDLPYKGAYDTAKLLAENGFEILEPPDETIRSGANT